MDGKVSNERFIKLTSNYEEEQRSLEARVSELKQRIKSSRELSANTDQFISLVRKYTDPECLTERIANDLISRIYVYKPEIINDEKKQQIRIEYNFVGNVILPSPKQKETA